MITREKLLNLCNKIISRNFDGEIEIKNFDLYETHEMNDKGDWYCNNYWIEMLVQIDSVSKNDPSKFSRKSLQDLLESITGFDFTVEVV